MTTEQQAAQKLRERIRRIFSTDAVIRADAQEAMKEAWGFDEPSFRIEELASQPAENCTIAAARRDGQKELLTWLLKI